MSEYFIRSIPLRVKTYVHRQEFHAYLLVTDDDRGTANPHFEPATQSRTTCFTSLCVEWLCNPRQISGSPFSLAHAQYRTAPTAAPGSAFRRRSPSRLAYR